MALARLRPLHNLGVLLAYQEGRYGYEASGSGPHWRQSDSLQAMAASSAAGEPGTACPALWGVNVASRGLGRWLSNQTRSQRSVLPHGRERRCHELVDRTSRRSCAGQLVGGDELGRIHVIKSGLRAPSCEHTGQWLVDVNSRIECPTKLLIDGY